MFFAVIILYSAPFLRIGFGIIRIDRHYRSITQYTTGLVNLCGIKTTKTGIALGSTNKKEQTLVHLVKPVEVNISAIHHTDSTGFDNQFIQDIDVMELGVGDRDKRWNAAPQIKEGMKFYTAFGEPQACPREK